MSTYDPYSSSGDDGMAAKKPPKPSTAWMITVADLFSLMLTFFVLLYSMSVIQKDKWDAISQSLMQRMQVQIDEEVPTTMPSDFDVMRADFIYARGLDYLSKVIDERLAATPAFEGVIVTRGENRITLSLTSDTLFAKGSARLSPASQRTLRQIGIFLTGIGNRVTIEGHTDPSPVHNASYPSNWELSMARASAVATALRNIGYPYTIDVYGLGSSRYGELSDMSSARREALARRVDIIVRETVAKY